MRPTSGADEDISNVFVTGPPLCLRENHEAETHYATWAKCGKSWAAHPDDVPYVPSADRPSYRRRLRCVRMRSKFSANPDESDPRDGVYLADDSIRDWLRSEEATSVFWTLILIPFIRSNSKSQREDSIRDPPAQQKEGADWLRRRMARKINVGAELFDDLGNPDDSRAVPVGNSSCISDDVVREAHA